MNRTPLRLTRMRLMFWRAVAGMCDPSGVAGSTRQARPCTAAMFGRGRGNSALGMTDLGGRLF